METFFKGLFFTALGLLILGGAFYVVCLQIPENECEEHFGLWWTNPQSKTRYVCVLGATIESNGIKVPLALSPVLSAPHRVRAIPIKPALEPQGL